jgi:hypothetical protein
MMLGGDQLTGPVMERQFDRVGGFLCLLPDADKPHASASGGITAHAGQSA